MLQRTSAENTDAARAMDDKGWRDKPLPVKQRSGPSEKVYVRCAETGRMY